MTTHPKSEARTVKLLRLLHPRHLLIGIAIAMGATVVVANAALVWTQAVEHWIRPLWRPGPPTVRVAKAEQRTVPLTLSFVANTVAPRQVEVRARVEGWLSERLFVEGGDVAEGQLLYVIDERPFQAALDEAKAQLAKDEATQAYAKEQVDRYGKLVAKEYVTRELYDQYVTQAAQAEAAVAADRAAVEEAELNLSYCRMVALVSGRIGRTAVDVGNLVGQAGTNTILTTIVPLDPIYALFSPDDDQMLQIAAARAKGLPATRASPSDSSTAREARQAGEIPATLTFQDGSAYAPAGKLEFIDNALDRQTSTVAMRAVFPNPDKALLPGLFVNVHLILGQVPDTVLVPRTAIDETQQGFVVYVVGRGDRVEVRPVGIGAVVGDRQVITKALAVGEVVIIEGMHKVKPGMKVQPEG